MATTRTVASPVSLDSSRREEEHAPPPPPGFEPVSISLEDTSHTSGPERKFQDLTPEEQREAGAGLGPNVPDDVPNMEYLESIRQTDADEYQAKVRAESTFMENLKKDIPAMVGSIVVPLLALHPGGRIASIVGGGAKLLAARGTASGLGAAIGEGYQMLNEWMRGDADAPEDALDVAKRAGTQAAWGVGGELGAAGLVRVGGYVGKAWKNTMGYAEESLRKIPGTGVARTFEGLDRVRYKDIKKLNDEIIENFSRAAGETLTPQQAGEVFRSAIKNQQAVPNLVIKNALREVDVAAGMVDDVGGSIAVPLGTVKEFAEKRLSFLLEPRVIMKSEDKKLVEQVLGQIRGLKDSTGFSEAFSLSNEMLEEAIHVAKASGNEALERHFKAIQQRIVSAMGESASRIGGQTKEIFESIFNNMDQVVKDANERFIRDYAMKHPERAGSAISQMSPKEVLNLKNSMKIYGEEGRVAFDRMANSYMSEVFTRVVDQDTGRVLVEPLANIFKDPNQQKIIHHLFGEVGEEKIQSIRRLLEKQTRQPGDYLIEGSLLLQFVKSKLGLPAILGGVVLDPTGTVAATGVLGVAIPAVAKTARGVGTTRDIAVDVLAELMSHPASAELLKKALSVGGDHPTGARILAQLGMAIAEADERIQLREKAGSATDSPPPPPAGFEPVSIKVPPPPKGFEPVSIDLNTIRVNKGPNSDVNLVNAHHRSNPHLTRDEAVKEAKRLGHISKDYKDPPLGIRNNNPGNIRKSSTSWKGKVEDGAGPFETFETPEHGIRALVVNLRSYERVHGLNTVQGLIHRWAPPNENATGSYINFVARELGVRPNDRLNLDDPNVMQKLVKAITQMENGQMPYDTAIINKGIKMANNRERG